MEHKEHSNHKENEEHRVTTNEKFIVEYPLNYNDIVDRKLKILEQEYSDTLKCDFRAEDLNDENELDSENEQGIPASHQDEKNPQIEEKEPEQPEENNYYQCLDENEDDEGFIEVTEECKNEEKNYLGDNMKINTDEEAFEFCETVQVEIVKNEENVPEKKSEPVKDPEKIKQAMKSINMNPPKWAQKYVFYIKNPINDSKLT